MGIDRTKKSAWDIVRQKAQESAKEVSDDRLRQIMDKETVKEIFDAEWDGQFEEERGPVQARIREIIDDGLDALHLERK
jgi:hypothetical protein